MNGIQILRHNWIFSILGIKKTIDLVQGMFAFALIDKADSKLYLGRDLFGENHYIILITKRNNIFIWAAWRKKRIFKINQKAIDQFLHYNYVPNSSCIYKNWKKVNPGEIIVFDKIIIKKYYEINVKIQDKKSILIKTDDNYLKKQFNEIFNKVIKETLIADVNVGVFLSGGIDHLCCFLCI